MHFNKKSTLISAAIFAGLMGACAQSTGDQPSSEIVNLGEIIRVSDQASFREAISRAQPGDEIVLANGEWRDFDALVVGEGTQNAPIKVSAETPGEVILTGQSSLRLGGRHLIVSGLVFKDGYTPRSEVISFRKDSQTLAFNSRVTNTVIDNYSNPVRAQRDLWVGMYGKENVFDYNHLSGKQNAGPTFAVRLNTEDSQENGHRIANNYFGPRPIFGSNGGETLRIGTSHYSLTNSNTVVENNFFDRCSGEVEIISNKSGGNVFRGNTFYASRGTLTLRHGNGTLVENNLFDGANAAYTGGVRVINARQTIRNNDFKDLTGNRFSGALVVMNGVPNSPINRYHQVDGAVIENNRFENVAAIELGEGSDAERTAVPINSSFIGNAVSGLNGVSPFSLYDDMSGIRFEDNWVAESPPAGLEQGFTVSDDLPSKPNRRGVRKDETGVSWYAKASEASPFGAGRSIAVAPGVDAISAALANAGPGDTLLLAPGAYHESKLSTLDFPVTIKGASADLINITFERPSLFVLTGNGSLDLSGVTIDGSAAPDGSGNSVISTSSVRGSGNHTLKIDASQFANLDINRGFSVVIAKKGTFFNEISVTGSSFRDISGTIFKIDEETDDYGIYNAEYLIIEGSTFDNIGGSIASVYRGGRDESTFGPHITVTASRFTDIGRSAAPLLRLHGFQQATFSGNAVSGALPLDMTITTGLPVFDQTGNTVDGQAVDGFSDLKDLRRRK